MNNAPLVRVNNLNLWMKNGDNEKQILKNVCFEVKHGQSLGIVGRSGAGKSMTMYALTDLLPEKSARLEGSIVYNGDTDILKMSKKERRSFCSKNAAIILQDSINALNPYVKVYRQLEETVCFHNRVSKKEAESKIAEMMEIVGLRGGKETLEKYPHQFSGGMRQRVAIALALESDAKLLIADEPTTSLDVVNQMRFVEFVKQICKERALALLYISHNLGLVNLLCEDVLVMGNGEILERGNVAEVFGNPQKDYTKELVSGTKKLLNG